MADGGEKKGWKYCPWCERYKPPTVIDPTSLEFLERRSLGPDLGMAWNPMRDYPRNMACFCLSGKKFKNCCISKLEDCIPAENVKALKAQLDRHIQKNGGKP